MAFEAKYSGDCAYGCRIEPGDLCTYTDDNEIAHVECEQLGGATNVHKPSICPHCNLDHHGECF